MNKQIGKVTRKIIKILKLDYKDELSIFIGEADLKHMKITEDFEKYGANIEDIINNPTYLARNEKRNQLNL